MNLLLNMTILTTIITVGILIIKSIFKNKMSAFFHYYIWIILLVRVVLIPVISEDKLKMFNFNNKNNYTSQISEGKNINFQDIGSTETLNVNEGKVEPSIIQYKMQEEIKNNLIIVWLLGGGILLSYYLCAYIHFSMKVNKIPECDDKEIITILNECKELVGTKRNVSLKIGDVSSMTKGVFSPVILINSVYDKNELKQVLIHELNHVKHNDTTINLLALIFLCVNWYNPIIWISFFTFQKDTEMLCDEKVIKLTNRKKEYAILLMKGVSKNNRSLISTISINRGKKEIKRRISFMANFKKPTAIYKVVMSLAVASICIASFITPKVNAASVSHDSNYTNEVNLLDENKQLIDEFSNSISYDKDAKVLKLTVPKTIPDGYKWLIHASGHELIDNVPVVFHAFEDESYNFTWAGGQTYTHEFKENEMSSCTIRIGLIDKDGENDIKNNVIVTINNEGLVRKTPEEIDNAIDKLLGTIKYNMEKNDLSFTIPETIPDNLKWFINVNGHEFVEGDKKNNLPVFHAFEDESSNCTWVKGKTYTHNFKENEMVSCNITIGLIAENSNDIQNKFTAVVDGDGNITKIIYDYPENK
ncbi:M56 family metallopeptidase [Clostridium weizhouense]|uniref:M56 family metallopeptidase n=1 Tax=Clostridium weizhouense TaxID=2859781 RepID=A0ABS7AKD9_9CLOT|nr:M56 family metallopeptidase [Clostridium weizhouense]MBW6409087.1 M56 family metallopeptidase [Clostridium weizhouense]